MFLILTLRNYPKEFGISSEITASFFANFVLNWFCAQFITHQGDIQDDASCVLFTLKGLSNMVRVLIFDFFLYWYTRETPDEFPLPFT